MRDILSIGLACFLGIVGMLVIVDLFVVPADSESVVSVTANVEPANSAPDKDGPTQTAAATTIPAVRDVTKDPFVSGPPPASLMERLERMAEAQTTPLPRPRPSVEQAFGADVDTHTVTVIAAHEGGPVMRVVEVRAGRENRNARGKPRCTTFRTYNPETGTYRGYDGLIHECRAY